MKISKRKVIWIILILLLIILLYYGLKAGYYYYTIKKMVAIATTKLSASIHTRYFILTHINGVPVIILKDKPKYYMKEYAKHFGEALRIMPALIPHFFISSEKFEEFKKIAMENAKYIPPYYRKELKYLSRYSGINFYELVMIHTFSDYFNYSSSFLCSVFAVNKSASKEKKILIARNLDYFVPFLKDLTVIHIFKRGKKKYFSIGFLGVFGVYSGMNSNGLVIANLLALNPKEKPKQTGTPSSFLYRKILETAMDIKTAAHILKKTYKPFSNNILVADENSAFIIEAFGETIRIRKFKNGYVYATNYILSKDIRGKKHIGRRYKTLTRIARAKQKIGVEDMKKVLDSVALKILTQHSIIFIPENRKIYFSYGEIPSSKGPYKEFNTNIFWEY